VLRHAVSSKIDEIIAWTLRTSVLATFSGEVATSSVPRAPIRATDGGSSRCNFNSLDPFAVLPDRFLKFCEV